MRVHVRCCVDPSSSIIVIGTKKHAYIVDITDSVERISALMSRSSALELIKGIHKMLEMEDGVVAHINCHAIDDIIVELVAVEGVGVLGAYDGEIKHIYVTLNRENAAPLLGCLHTIVENSPI